MHVRTYIPLRGECHRDSRISSRRYKYFSRIDSIQVYNLRLVRPDRRKDEGAERETWPLSLRNVGSEVAFTARSAAGEQWRWKEEGRPVGEERRETVEKRARESYLTYFLSYVAHRAKRLSKGQKLSNQSVLIGANTACRLCSAMDDERKEK